MTREEHKAIVQQMLGMVQPDKQAEASQLLTTLSEDYEETLTNYETASSNVQDLTTKNETLRDVNAKLFLKVGSTENNTNANPNTAQDNAQEDENKMTFEALFNEKGELI